MLPKGIHRPLLTFAAGAIVCVALLFLIEML